MKRYINIEDPSGDEHTVAFNGPGIAQPKGWKVLAVSLVLILILLGASCLAGYCIYEFGSWLIWG